MTKEEAAAQVREAAAKLNKAVVEADECGVFTSLHFIEMTGGQTGEIKAVGVEMYVPI